MTIAPSNFNILVSTVTMGINAAWQDGVPTVYSQIAQTQPSGGAQNVYPWIGMLPKMRLWNGPRVTFEPAPQTYTVTNQTFELTMQVDRFTLEDDQYGYLQYMLPFFARQAMRQPDYMLRDLVENSGDQTGSRQLGPDGLNGFSTLHPINFYNASQGTYINDFGGGGQTVAYPTANGGTTNVTVGGLFSPNAFMSSYNYMKSIKAEDGEPFGLLPDKLMHAPFLKGEVDLVLRAQFYAPAAWGTITGQVGTADSPTKRFGIEPIENVLLADQYNWYLMDTRAGFRPFIHQVREIGPTVPRVNENDPVVFDQHTFLYGKYDRLAMAFGPPFLFNRNGP